MGKIPWRSDDNPPQYFCPENPTDRGAWRATVHGVAKSRTCVCVCEYIFDVSLDSLEEYTNSVTWRVRLGRSDRGLHIFLPYILNNNQNVGGVLNKIKVALA